MIKKTLCFVFVLLIVVLLGACGISSKGIGLIEEGVPPVDTLGVKVVVE